jgi:hypothetical protein
MLVWRLNLEWKSGHPNQCLRLGNDVKTDRTLRARFRGIPSYGASFNKASRISDTEHVAIGNGAEGSAT